MLLFYYCVILLLFFLIFFPLLLSGVGRAAALVAVAAAAADDPFSVLEAEGFEDEFAAAPAEGGRAAAAGAARRDAWGDEDEIEDFSSASKTKSGDSSFAVLTETNDEVDEVDEVQGAAVRVGSQPEAAWVKGNPGVRDLAAAGKTELMRK